MYAVFILLKSDFVHHEISDCFRTSISLLTAKLGKVCFSLPCLNTRCATTPETEECLGTEEKEDRKNFKAIKLFESQ